MIDALKRLLTQFGLTLEKINGKWRARWGWFDKTPQSPYADISQRTGTAIMSELNAQSSMNAAKHRIDDKPKTYGDIAGRVLLRSLKHRMEEEAKAPPKPLQPIIPDAVQRMWRRERIAKALYEHWVKEDELHGNEYVCWHLLPDKATWYNRADAVIAADPKE